MAKLEKLRRRIENNPRDVRFSELKRLLEAHGFVARSPSGSHWTFYHPKRPDVGILTVAEREPCILVPYVKQAIKVIREVEEFDGRQQD